MYTYSHNVPFAIYQASAFSNLPPGKKTRAQPVMYGLATQNVEGMNVRLPIYIPLDSIQEASLILNFMAFANPCLQQPQCQLSM